MRIERRADEVVVAMSANEAAELGTAILAIDPQGYDDVPIAAEFAKRLLELAAETPPNSDLTTP